MLSKRYNGKIEVVPDSTLECPDFFVKWQDWERKSYTDISISSVLCHSINPAARYWSSVLYPPNYPGLGD